MILRKISVIIVIYNVSTSNIYNMISMISDEYEIIIVDNSDQMPLNDFFFDRDNIFYICMTGNVGIASAQNIGANTAFANGATDIIFFDQDSEPNKTLIIDLLDTRECAQNAGFNVAAVGPQQYDARNGFLSNFIKVNKLGVEKISVPQCLNFCVCSFLIASGSLISKEAWNAIGPNEDGLFIDCVDLEWGFRATSKGYHCIGSFKAQMNHCIGDDHIVLFGKALTNHIPVRHYYFYRNFYRLLRRNYIPLSWKIHVFTKSIIQAMVFSILGSDKKSQFKMIIRGIWDGLHDREGKFK